MDVIGHFWVLERKLENALGIVVFCKREIGGCHCFLAAKLGGVLGHFGFWQRSWGMSLEILVLGAKNCGMSLDFSFANKMKDWSAHI